MDRLNSNSINKDFISDNQVLFFTEKRSHEKMKRLKFR